MSYDFTVHCRTVLSLSVSLIKAKWNVAAKSRSNLLYNTRAVLLNCVYLNTKKLYVMKKYTHSHVERTTA